MTKAFTIYKNNKNNYPYSLCAISYEKNIVNVFDLKKIYFEDFAIGDDESIFNYIFEKNGDDINFDLCILYSENYSYSIIKMLSLIKSTINIPILVMSGVYDEIFTVDLLRIGADECVLSTIGKSDLNVRIEKLIETNRKIKKSVYIENLKDKHPINDNNILAFEKFYKYFTPSEIKIISKLIENIGKVVYREVLSAYTRDAYRKQPSRSVDNLIFRIRKKFKMLSLYGYQIKTSNSFGYILIGDADSFFYDLSGSIDSYEKNIEQNSRIPDRIR